MAFTIRATKDQPLENPAFIIANWGSNDRNVSLRINGQAESRSVDCRTGIEVDTDGTYTLVVWVPFSSTEMVSFEMGGDK